MANDSIFHNFYVYVHKRASDGNVFYVGKGSNYRAWSTKGDGRSRHWQHVVRKHGLIVEIVEHGLQEWYAFELEKELILRYGRIDNNTGCLVNLTDGGDGASGFVAPEWLKKHWGEKSRQAQSRPEVKERHRRSMLENKERIVAAIKNSWERPQRRANHMEGIKKRDKQVYTTLGKNLTKSRQNPEVEARRVAATKLTWLQTDVAERMIKNRVRNRLKRLEDAGQSIIDFGE